MAEENRSQVLLALTGIISRTEYSLKIAGAGWCGSARVFECLSQLAGLLVAFVAYQVATLRAHSRKRRHSHLGELQVT